jgi:ribose transport system substrate-binding protein
MRKLSLVAFVTLALVAFSGCSAEGGFGSTSSYLIIVGKSTKGKYWEAIQAGAAKQAEVQHLTISYRAPEDSSDSAAQLVLLRQAMEDRPSAIGFAPIDPTDAVDLAREIKEAGIPLIVFDTKLEGFSPNTTVATDNESAAKEAARHMCDLIDDTGSVTIVAADLGHQTGIERYTGFQEGLESECPKVKLLDPPVNILDDAAKAAQDFQQQLAEQHPDGVFISDPAGADFVIPAVEASDDPPVVVGFDSGSIQVKAIRDQVEAGAITQNPTGMGAQVVSATVKMLAGDKLPRLIDTGYFWYDSSNIDKPAIQAVIDD